MAFPVMAAVQGGLALASGISDFIQSKKLAKRQKEEARKFEERSEAAYGKRDALLQEGLAGTRQRAGASQAAGFTEAKEMMEKGTGTAIDAARRGTTSSADYLATVSALNQKQQQQSQQLGLQNIASRERAFNQLLGQTQLGASYASGDAATFGQRSAQLAEASDLNKAAAWKGLFGGAAEASAHIPAFRGTSRKTTTMSGTGAGMNLF